MLPLSTNYPGMSTGELVQAAADKSKQLNESWVKENVGEVEYAQITNERMKSAGSWELTADPALQEFSKSASSEYGLDKNSVSGSIAGFRSMLTSTFSGVSVPANYAPSINPSFVSIDRISGAMGVAPTSILEQSRNYGVFKTPQGAFDCQRNIFQATAAAVGQVALSAVSNQLRGIQAVAMSVEFLMKSVTDIKSAIMDMSVQNLLSIIVSQDLILDQIISVTKNINELVSKIEDTDYSIVHLIVVRRDQIRLQQAVDKLDVLKLRLLYGADFDYVLWDSAREDVKVTEADFCGGVEAGISFKMIQLVGLRAYLAILLRILARQQEQRDALENALQGFSDDFDAATQLDNLYVPIVEAVKCRLEAILEDMEATAAKNQILSFLIKEKLWCLELKVISAFMKFTSKNKFPETLNKISGTSAIQDAADKVLGFLADKLNNIRQASAESVLYYGAQYLSLLDRKMQYDIDPRFITSVGDNLISAAMEAKSGGSVFGGLLNGFSGSVATSAAVAVTAVAGLMEFAKEQNLSSFSDAIGKGKITEAFGLDSFTASIQGQAGSITAQLASVANSSNLSNTAVSELNAASQTFQDEARNLSLTSSLETDYAENHMVDKVEVQYREAQSRHNSILNAGQQLVPGIQVANFTAIV